MTRLVLGLLALTSATFAAALQAPEIDANVGASAITLLAGGTMVLRSAIRRRK